MATKSKKHLRVVQDAEGDKGPTQSSTGRGLAPDAWTLLRQIGLDPTSLETSKAAHYASGSATDRLIRCTWWASPLVASNVADPWGSGPMRGTDPIYLRFGSAFHETMEVYLKLAAGRLKRALVETIAKKWGEDIEIDRLEDYHVRGVGYVQDLLKNGWDIEYIETKFAYDPFQDSSRILRSKTARDYSEKKPTEFPMTLDLAVRKKNVWRIIDWKTGQGVYDPAENGQVRSGSLAVSRIHNPLAVAETPMIGVLVRLDDEFTEANEAPITHEIMMEHRNVLRNRIRDALYDPFMRPGYHCGYCRALEICPAHRDTLGLGDMLERVVQPEDVGRLYESASVAKKLLEDRIYPRIGQYIDDNGPAPLPNGKYLTRIAFDEETLSKASITRALGKVRGEELIQELRDKGVVEVHEKRQLKVKLEASAKK